MRALPTSIDVSEREKAFLFYLAIFVSRFERPPSIRETAQYFNQDLASAKAVLSRLADKGCLAINPDGDEIELLAKFTAKPYPWLHRRNKPLPQDDLLLKRLLSAIDLVIELAEQSYSRLKAGFDVHRLGFRGSEKHAEDVFLELEKIDIVRKASERPSELEFVEYLEVEAYCTRMLDLELALHQVRSQSPEVIVAECAEDMTRVEERYEVLLDACNGLLNLYRDLRRQIVSKLEGLTGDTEMTVPQIAGYVWGREYQSRRRCGLESQESKDRLVRAWIKKGRLPARKIPRKHGLYWVDISKLAAVRKAEGGDQK